MLRITVARCEPQHLPSSPERTDYRLRQRRREGKGSSPRKPGSVRETLNSFVAPAIIVKINEC